MIILEDDDESYAMKDFIRESIDFCVDLLLKNSIIEAFRAALYTF